MKKIIIICGLISGTIVSVSMAIGMSMSASNPDYEGNMIIGYASMVLAFSLIFVGVKNYRDKHNDGAITFGKAFSIGAYIALIASTIYVATWAVEYNFFMPDFMDKYAAHMATEAQKAGVSGEGLKEKLKQIEKYKEMYKNPIYFTLMTYTEILPVGILVSLVVAAILRKKPAQKYAA